MLWKKEKGYLRNCKVDNTFDATFKSIYLPCWSKSVKFATLLQKRLWGSTLDKKSFCCLYSCLSVCDAIVKYPIHLKFGTNIYVLREIICIDFSLHRTNSYTKQYRDTEIQKSNSIHYTLCVCILFGLCLEQNRSQK